MVFAIIVANIYTLDLFNSNELNLGASQSIDHKVGVRVMFSRMRIALSLFKTLTHFNSSWSLRFYVFWWYPPFKPMQEPPMKFTLCMGDKLCSPQSNVCSNSFYT
jgi:hypothetical protein